ncbi:hypothetical protein C8J56DRAFT_795812, partial [Mycena floridula]
LSLGALLHYLKTYWMSEKILAVCNLCEHLFRDVLNDSNMNMLIEAWHHVLKTTFLEGKCNRRMDFLLHILVNKVVPF